MTHFKSGFAALLMIVAPVALGDYTIKDGNNVAINVASEVVAGTHVPVMIQKPSSMPSTGFDETLDFAYVTEAITSLDDTGPVVFEPEVNAGLVLLSDIGGATSLNGYWHSADGSSFTAIVNSAYTSGGDVVSIPTVGVKQDTIIDRVQLQVEDAGATASILGANTAGQVKVYAYNPNWPGEKVTLLDYTNPNSIYKHLGTISQSVINSKIYQTFTISNPKFVPSGWMIAAETPQSYSLDQSDVNILGKVGTGQLILDPGYFDESGLNVPVVRNEIPEGTEILENSSLEDPVDNDDLPDWPDSGTLDGSLFESDGMLAVRTTTETLALFTQDVVLTPGSDYYLQIYCKGSEIIFGLQGPTFFFTKTASNTEMEYFHMKFRATSDEYTVTVVFPRSSGYYYLDSIQLWED